MNQRGSKNVRKDNDNIFDGDITNSDLEQSELLSDFYKKNKRSSKNKIFIAINNLIHPEKETNKYLTEYENTKQLTKKDIATLNNILTEFEHDPETLFPGYRDFLKYFSKSHKLSRELIDKTAKFFNSLQFVFLFNDNDLKRFNRLISSMENFDEIISECRELINQENNRIKVFQNEQSTAFENAKMINQLIIDGGYHNYEDTSFKWIKDIHNEDLIPFFVTNKSGMKNSILQIVLRNAVVVKPLKWNIPDYMEVEDNFLAFFHPLQEETCFLNSFLKPNRDDPAPEIPLLMGVPINLIIEKCQLNYVCILGNWGFGVDKIINKVSLEEYEKFRSHVVFLLGQKLQNHNFTDDVIAYTIQRLKELLNLETDIELALFLYKNYVLSIKNIENYRIDLLGKYDVQILDRNVLESQKNKYLNTAIEEGIYNQKWINELSLFKLVLKNYPDAIFQYKSYWLGNQSLDIYVPSINTGIEYQGKQHFESIPFFGGDKALEDRKYLDSIKLEKCNINNVKLIYWNYDEPVTKSMLKFKLNSL